MQPLYAHSEILKSDSFILQFQLITPLNGVQAHMLSCFPKCYLRYAKLRNSKTHKYQEPSPTPSAK